MNEQLEQTYWEAYKSLRDLKPEKFKDMSFEEFIHVVDTMTWEEFKEAV